MRSHAVAGNPTQVFCKRVIALKHGTLLELCSQEGAFPSPELMHINEQTAFLPVIEGPCVCALKSPEAYVDFEQGD